MDLVLDPDDDGESWIKRAKKAHFTDSQIESFKRKMGEILAKIKIGGPVKNKG